MSKLARALILAATVAALNLAGMTAIARAQANDQDPPQPAGAGRQLELLQPGDPHPAGGTEGPDAG
jgi:hypothetical protein